MIELSLILCETTTMSVLLSRHFLIKPDGFSINNTRLHGITNQIASESGVTLESIMDEISRDYFAKCNCIAAHGFNFHAVVFYSELSRCGNQDAISSMKLKRQVCTMFETRTVVKLQKDGSKAGDYKLPSLDELFKYACDEEGLSSTGKLTTREEENSATKVDKLLQALMKLKERKEYSI